jgi:hypothetical protein
LQFEIKQINQVKNDQKAIAKLSHLQFYLHITDPEHKLEFTMVTQSIPEMWLQHWEKHDWVKDLVVELLRVGVQIIGQDYCDIAARMGWIESKVERSAPLETVINPEVEESASPK